VINTAADPDTALTDISKCSFSEISTKSTFDEQRRIEVQLLNKLGVVDVTLIFENFPVWLLGVEPICIGHLHVHGHGSCLQLTAWLNKRGHPGNIVE
jgi:hypothetical protein